MLSLSCVSENSRQINDFYLIRILHSIDRNKINEQMVVFLLAWIIDLFFRSLLSYQKHIQNTKQGISRKLSVGGSLFDDVCIRLDQFFARQKLDLIQKYGSIRHLKDYPTV